MKKIGKNGQNGGDLRPPKNDKKSPKWACLVDFVFLHYLTCFECFKKLSFLRYFRVTDLVTQMAHFGGVYSQYARIRGSTPPRDFVIAKAVKKGPGQLMCSYSGSTPPQAKNRLFSYAIFNKIRVQAIRCHHILVLSLKFTIKDQFQSLLELGFRVQSRGLRGQKLKDSVSELKSLFRI